MVMPLVILLTGMVLYLTFYFYDRCVIAQDVYILAFRGSLCCGEDAGKVEQYIMAERAGKFGKKYIGAAHFNSRAQVNGRTVTVEADGSMAATGWGFGAKWQAQRICPTDCVRKVRMAEKIKGDITWTESNQ